MSPSRNPHGCFLSPKKFNKNSYPLRDAHGRFLSPKKSNKNWSPLRHDRGQNKINKTLNNKNSHIIKSLCFNEQPPKLDDSQIIKQELQKVRRELEEVKSSNIYVCRANQVLQRELEYTKRCTSMALLNRIKSYFINNNIFDEYTSNEFIKVMMKSSWDS